MPFCHYAVHSTIELLRCMCISSASSWLRLINPMNEWETKSVYAAIDFWTIDRVCHSIALLIYLYMCIIGSAEYQKGSNVRRQDVLRIVCCIICQGAKKETENDWNLSHTNCPIENENNLACLYLTNFTIRRWKKKKWKKMSYFKEMKLSADCRRGMMNEKQCRKNE